MRYIVFALCSFLCLNSCQSDNTNQNSKPSESVEEKASNVSENRAEQLCYETSSGEPVFNIRLKDNNGSYTGEFSIKGGNEENSGTIKGQEREGDLIADMEYVIDGKKHQEKVIITIVGNSLSIARSGSVNIDGERKIRNGGVSTLDVLGQIDCTQ